MSERLLRAREVAELLGLSTATVLDWAEAGRLPHFKLTDAPNGPVRFRLSEVEACLEARHVPSRDAGGVSCARPSGVVR